MARGRIFLPNGQQLALGKELGTGGEGTTYRLAGASDVAVKMYHASSLAARGKLYERKLSAMVSNRPAEAANGVSLAWPISQVVDGKGNFVGFTMPLVDTKTSVKWHNAANPSTRDTDDSMPPWLKGFSWRYRLQACRNLAGIVDVTHTSKYVVGDLNQQNIFVDGQSIVRLIDVDSIQVPDQRSGEVLPCTVFAEGFLAPELMGRDLKLVARLPSSDYFVMAVHFYKMLMEGWSPFNVNWMAPGEKPNANARIQEGLYVNALDRRIARPRNAPEPEILPGSLVRLFSQAFVDGSRNPAARPTALQWTTALVGAARDVKSCGVNAAHDYSSHLSRCPWCDRANRPSVTGTFQMPRSSSTVTFGTRAPTTGRPGGSNSGYQGPRQQTGQFPPYAPTRQPPYRPTVGLGGVAAGVSWFGALMRNIVILIGVLVAIVFAANSCTGGSSGQGASSSSPNLAAGDLGLDVPIQNLQCSGDYILVLRSAITPENYEQDVISSLSQYSGSLYLRTDQSCSSFAQQSTSGNPIYAVYYGLFSTADEALAYCELAPNDAYAKELSSIQSTIYCNE